MLAKDTSGGSRYVRTSSVLVAALVLNLKIEVLNTFCLYILVLEPRTRTWYLVRITRCSWYIVHAQRNNASGGMLNPQRNENDAECACKCQGWALVALTSKVPE